VPAGTSDAPTKTADATADAPTKTTDVTAAKTSNATAEAANATAEAPAMTAAKSAAVTATATTTGFGCGGDQRNGEEQHCGQADAGLQRRPRMFASSPCRF
jgi:hypothetical protein